ncbi:hypothetical protein B0H15DRAFT_821823 [Mycena belliarum]|uniref:Uncharacterized protein n=1 Tax=Mycena belliarum TaxID=1033014 RepID=A0AAD6UJA7_9AGAR|nr:hypothetical protein B0H15DRAFT_821823 [Mycena belliae]
MEVESRKRIKCLLRCLVFPSRPSVGRRVVSVVLLLSSERVASSFAVGPPNSTRSRSRPQVLFGGVLHIVAARPPRVVPSYPAARITLLLLSISAPSPSSFPHLAHAPRRAACLLPRIWTSTRDLAAFLPPAALVDACPSRRLRAGAEQTSADARRSSPLPAPVSAPRPRPVPPLPRLTFCARPRPFPRGFAARRGANERACAPTSATARRCSPAPSPRSGSPAQRAHRGCAPPPPAVPLAFSRLLLRGAIRRCSPAPSPRSASPAQRSHRVCAPPPAVPLALALSSPIASPVAVAHLVHAAPSRPAPLSAGPLPRRSMA